MTGRTLPLASPQRDGSELDVKGTRRSRVSTSRFRPLMRSGQVAACIVFLLLWQYLPSIGWLSAHGRIFDKFFVGSPSGVYRAMVDLMTGRDSTALVWPYLATTVKGAVIGTGIGLLLGAAVGVLFSNSERLSAFAQPFVVLFNTIPRVALIPIFVLLVGPTVGASVVSIIATVFFLGFYNALEGGRSVKTVLLDNAKLMNAARWRVLLYIRLPAAATWTFATVPNAISFGLVIAVTTELLAGIPGMGYLLLNATTQVNANITFAVIVMLSAVGLILYAVSMLLKRRIIHWEGK